MKKNILLIALVILPFVHFAQGNLPVGEKRINAGTGFSNFGFPVYVGLDVAIHPDITVGPQISFRRYSTRDFGVRYNQSLILLALNGDYHFNTLLELPREFDVYAGVALGYYIWTDPDFDDNPFFNDLRGEVSGIGLALHIGGRYFFSDDLALNVEIGGGTTSDGKIGITYQF